MHCLDGRVILPELLDDTEPRQAARSLNDLTRINRYLGGYSSLKKLLGDHVPAPAGRFTILDVGAASGDMGRAIREQFPEAAVTSLDYRESHLAAASAPRVAGDAFALPFRDKSFDAVFCSLFLHHFENEQVIGLLGNFGRIARGPVIVSDLERHLLAYYFLPLTRWLFHWDPITVHDGPISVEAAFRKKELAELAAQAGFREIVVRSYRPAFRLGMVCGGQVTSNES